MNGQGPHSFFFFFFFLEESFSLVTWVRFQGLFAFPFLLVSQSSCHFFVFLQSSLLRWPTCEESDVDLRNVSRVLPPKPLPSVVSASGFTNTASGELLNRSMAQA